MFWRVPCKIYPDYFQGAHLIFFFWFISMTPNFFQGARLKKIWVDFTGYPSNQFSGYRLNGQLDQHNKWITAPSVLLTMNYLGQIISQMQLQYENSTNCATASVSSKIQLLKKKHGPSSQSEEKSAIFCKQTLDLAKSSQTNPLYYYSSSSLSQFYIQLVYKPQ